MSEAGPDASSGMVGADVHCDVCGYELAGLARAGVCPECAEPIETSLNPAKSLRNTDPEWLRGTVLGVTILTWTCRGIIVAGVTMVLATIVLSSLDVSEDHWLGTVFLVAMLGTIVVSFVLHGYGAWKLAAVPQSGRAPTLRARSIVRWGGPCFVVLVGASTLWGRFGAPTAGALTVNAIASIAGFGVGIVYVMSLSETVEGLERRTGGWTPAIAEEHSKYRRNIKVVAVIGAILFLVASCQGAIAAFGQAGGFGMFLVILSMLFLETGLARLGKGIRAEMRGEMRAEG